jgi:hypothetical protein
MSRTPNLSNEYWITFIAARSFYILELDEWIVFYPQAPKFHSWRSRARALTGIVKRAELRPALQNCHFDVGHAAACKSSDGCCCWINDILAMKVQKVTQAHAFLYPFSQGLARVGWQKMTLRGVVKDRKRSPSSKQLGVFFPTWLLDSAGLISWPWRIEILHRNYIWKLIFPLHTLKLFALLSSSFQPQWL